MEKGDGHTSVLKRIACDFIPVLGAGASGAKPPTAANAPASTAMVRNGKGFAIVVS